MNPFLIIFTVLNILATIINILTLIKMSDIEADVIIEKAGLINAAKNTVTPVAEIKATWSDEDLEKIAKMLKKSKVTRCDEKGIVIEEKRECDHFYDSVVLVNDPRYCREKLVFHCGRCGHGEIIPIRKGLIGDLIRNGGGA